MTTGFSEDATVMVNENRQLLFPPVTTNVMDSQTIPMFMGRPQVVVQNSWTSASLSNAQLFSFSIRNTLLTNLYWSEKFRGYKFLRGTAVVRLELNAQPFHAGKLLMHFLPQYDTRILTNSVFDQHNVCLCAKTQQNCVEIDCRDSAAIMKIPFISPFSHCDLDSPSNESDWGRVFLSVLSPLATGTGQDSAEYTIFLSFEDVELMAPIAQSGRQPNKGTLRKERVNMARTGKISGTLDALVEPVSYFKSVPIVGGFVDTAQNILKGAAGIFSAFGWSKPIDLNTSEPFVSVPHRTLHTYNGVDTSDVLAMDSNNQLEHVEDLGGVGHDEMSFSYLKTIPAYYTRFSWQSSALSSSKIYEVIVAPQFLREIVTQSFTSGNIQMAFSPPAMYLSKYFDLYRGSFNVTLKFVKTQFHTGRLLVVYSPKTATTLGSTQNSLREVVDLKDSNEITLNLPYLSNKSYLRTGYGQPITDVTGTLSVYVLNPLVATDNVASSIEVLCYASAGEDFELARPVVQNDYHVIAPQMNVIDTKELVHKRIGGYPSTELSMVPVQTCIGEAFTSLKQLCLCARPITMTQAPQTNRPQNLNFALSFWPWSFGIPTSSPTAASTTVRLPPIGLDYISELATGFAYYRGGLRYTIPSITIPSACSTYAYLSPRNLGDSVNQVIPAGNTATFRGNLSSTTDFSVGDLPNSKRLLNIRAIENSACLDVKVPYYGTTPFRLTHVNTNLDVNIPATTDVVAETIVITSNNTGFLTSGLFRSGGDDFQFSYFIGFGGFRVA